jgi:hypothetical protein
MFLGADRTKTGQSDSKVSAIVEAQRRIDKYLGQAKPE